MSQIVIITGLSGSGKSTALNALEDIDFYAVDNLPVKLLPKFVELIDSGAETEKAALVMDLRDQSFLENYKESFETVLHMKSNIEVVFLDSTEETLIRRFSETRRKHPLSKDNVAEGIRQEKKALSDLKEMASLSIDTSEMDVHTLKKRVCEHFQNPAKTKLQVRLFSFGYKHGAPKNADILLDVRFLRNPHFSDELRSKTGNEESVQAYIEEDPRTAPFTEKTEAYLAYLIPQYLQEGKKYLSIGIGCTGGKHRSVYITERLAKMLGTRLQDQVSIRVDHEDIGK